MRESVALLGLQDGGVSTLEVEEEPPEAGKGKKTDSSLEPPEGTRPCQQMSLVQGDPF